MVEARCRQADEAFEHLRWSCALATLAFARDGGLPSAGFEIVGEWLALLRAGDDVLLLPFVEAADDAPRSLLCSYGPFEMPVTLNRASAS